MNANKHEKTITSISSEKLASIGVHSRLKTKHNSIPRTTNHLTEGNKENGENRKTPSLFPSVKFHPLFASIRVHSRLKHKKQNTIP